MTDVVNSYPTDTAPVRVQALRRGHCGKQLRHRGAVFDISAEQHEGALAHGNPWFVAVDSSTPIDAGNEAVDLSWAEVTTP